MPAPTTQRPQFGDLFGSTQLPVLEELFQLELAQHPSRREMLFKVVGHDRDIYQTTEIHDMDLFSEVSEGQQYNFKTAKQGANKTYTIKKFGLGFSISEEMVDDGKFAFIADMVRKLAKSARESQEVSAMNIFNNGFTSETTADGVSVYNTAHPLPSGGSYRNRLSVDSDLSVTSLETMLLDYETQFLGDSGIIYNPQARWLVVHPSNKRLAKELIGSELKPDTTEAAGGSGITNINNMNSFREEGLSVASSPHLTDTDAWFMHAASADTGLRIISRKPIETKAAGPDVGFLTDAIYYKSRYREDLGVNHGYGIIGTPGA